MEGKRWHTREDSGIRLDKRLRWFHDDAPVEHPKIIEVFNSSLRLMDDGRYQLQVGNDWCFVTIEDAAFEVRLIDPLPDGSVLLRLSDRNTDRLDPKTLALDEDGTFVCRVKNGRAKARFSREAQFALGELLEPTERGLEVVVNGVRAAAPLLPADVR